MIVRGRINVKKATCVGQAFQPVLCVIPRCPCSWGWTGYNACPILRREKSREYLHDLARKRTRRPNKAGPFPSQKGQLVNGTHVALPTSVLYICTARGFSAEMLFNLNPGGLEAVRSARDHRDRTSVSTSRPSEVL